MHSITNSNIFANFRLKTPDSAFPFVKSSTLQQSFFNLKPPVKNDLGTPTSKTTTPSFQIEHSIKNPNEIVITIKAVNANTCKLCPPCNHSVVI